MDLSAEQGRVLGSLIEKSLATPQQYPLTVNALQAACNQASNRDPVIHLAEEQVNSALGKLKEQGLVRFVHPSHGRSAIRYRSVLHEMFALDEQAQALIALLLLRGPQTAGELRTRSERMAAFDGLAGVEATLRRLAEHPDGLVACLPRRPGQKEERWAQLLAAEPTGLSPGPGDGAGRLHASRQLERQGPGEGGDEVLALAQPTAMTDLPSPAPGEQAAGGEVRAVPDRMVVPAALTSAGGPPADGGGSAALAELRGEMLALTKEVARLREELAELRRNLGG